MSPISSRGAVVALLCESFFCGMLTILFGVSVYVVLFRRARTRTAYALLAVNIVLYAMSVIHWIVNSVVILGVVSVGRAEDVIITWFPTINYIFSDAIVVWRVWLIWERNAKICIPSFVCLIGTLVCILIGIVSRDRSFSLVVLIWCFLLSSNLWTTLAIAWRAWRHRRFIKSQLGVGTARTNVEKILGLLIESGTMYFCIWSLYVVIYYSLQTSAFIPDTIVVQLVALYPLIIIIVVHMQATSSNSLSKTLVSSIDFVTPPDKPSGNADS